MSERHRVLIVAGYFDWFSGYQETALAVAFAGVAETEVVASDRVSPAFSDGHLVRLGVLRRYDTGSAVEHGVTVTRFRSRELRSMVWAADVARYIRDQPVDLIIQVMPGQGLPIAASLGSSQARRIALYGDNRAMWAHLSAPKRLLKGAAFAVSKGAAYSFVNARADHSYGYTENTLTRLRPFRGGHPMSLMPLAFDATRFSFDESVRRDARTRLGYGDDDIVILAAGKFEHRKRLDWLVSAFEELRPGDPRLKLLLVGADESPHSLDFLERARQSPDTDHIQTRGFMGAAELNEVFNAADLGVWPRNPAITIQQAMGTGLAVALPRNEYVGHLLRSGAGSYYDLTDGREVAAICDALTGLIAEGSFSSSDRVARAALNSWLSADNLARQLLSDVRA